MLNQSPFAKKNGADNIEEAIRNYDFAYRLKGDEENTGAEVPDGSYRMIWNNMPSYMKESFGDVFKRRKDVPLSQWIDNLRRYVKELNTGRRTRELKPVLYYDPKGEFTTTYRCDRCGKERNMPKERFDNQEKYHTLHLCNDCLALRNIAKEAPPEAYSAVGCSKCGRSFSVDPWDKWLIVKKFKDGVCGNCSQKVAFTCSYCGKSSEMKNYFYKELVRFKQPLLCNDCNSVREELEKQPVYATCSRCGGTYRTNAWDKWKIDNRFKKAKCPACKEGYNY